MDTVTLATITVPPAIKKLLADRQAAHSVIMSSLPSKLGNEPRAAAKCLWALPEENTLLVQTTLPFRADNFGTPTTTVRDPLQTGDRITAALDIACLFTPPADVPPEIRADLKAATGKAYRSRQLIVPEDRRRDWFIGRLLRIGFDVDPASLLLSTVSHADLGRRGGRIPYLTARFAAVIVDADAANDAIREGVGKGKNFGLGLIRPIESI